MITVYSNAICAQKTLDKIKDDNTKEFLNSHMAAFIFGSFSYDILEAFDIFSKQRNTWVRTLALFIKENQNKFLDIAKQYIAKAPKEEKDSLSAYLCAAALHKAFTYRSEAYFKWILKSASSESEENALTVKADCAYATYEECEFNLADTLQKLSEKDIKAVSLMYVYVIGELKKEIIPENLIEDCLGKLQKVLTQKKSIFKRSGKEFVYQKQSDFSLLNLNHAPWQDPENENEKNNFSYPEMMGYAQRDAAKILPKFSDMVKNAISNQSCEVLFRSMK